MKAVGLENREKVFEVLEEGRWLSPAEIIARTKLSRSTVGGHLRALEMEHRVQKEGKGRYTKWRKPIAEVVQGSFGDNTGNDDK